MKIVKLEGKEFIFPYIAYIPDTISDNPAMLLHLHGAGERGNGGEELDKVTVWGFPKVVNDENLKDCILIMPQCPSDTFWAARVESIRSFIDIMIEKYSIDQDRIYLCGLSMGGYGTWYTAMAYPNLFAAIAPCCGGGMPWNSNVLRMPVFAFHGDIDDCVSVNETLSMVEAMRKYGLDPVCTIYEGVGHNSWERAFSPELLEKLLSIKK